jgi:hypothetical protein
MKISKHLSVAIFISAIWSLLDIQSPAQGFTLRLPVMNFTPAKMDDRRKPTLTQNSGDSAGNSEVNKDLKLREISITRDSSDNSLLTVKGSISNRSDRQHFVYYIVAKFISKDASIKQAIIPINSNIEPGKSAEFNHEITTESINSVAPETVKVVKYEYR